MKNEFQHPRGTADLLPEHIPAWTFVENQAREQLACFGYRELRTPVFEETALFCRSIGQSSDIVQKQMLNLSVQGQEKEDNEDVPSKGLSLRPEGTAAVVRSYIENRLDKKESLSKLFYIGPMFRGERPQKGRLRQFHQIGMEAIGPESASPHLDAEVIVLCLRILSACGITNFQLKINTLGTPQDKQSFHDVLRTILAPRVTSLCLDCQSRMERNVLRVLDCKQGSCKAVVRDIDIGQDWLSEESRMYFSQVRQALDSLDIPYLHDPKLVRGLDYYTHTVFEVSCPDLGSQDALGAGGRYNGLVSQLGGPQVDAVGFALGMERMLLAGNVNDSETLPGIDLYLAVQTPELLPQAFVLAHQIRAQGVSAEMTYRRASLKSQMRQANKMNAQHVLFLGEEEVQKGIFKVKEMASGQEREYTSFPEMLNVIKERC